MATTVADRNKPFGEVLQALDLKEQRKALRSALRRSARLLQADAVNNMRAAGLTAPGRTWGGSSKSYKGNPEDLKRAIVARVYPEKYGAGFLLTTKPHRGGRDKRIMHTNRQGKMKPVLMWAEDGTNYRRVGRRRRSFFTKSRFTGKDIRNYIRGGHSTGKMRGYHFMHKTEEQGAPKVEANLFADFQKNIEKAARKKGLY